MPDPPTAEPTLPSARQLAWLLAQPTSALGAVAAAVVARVEQDGTAKAVADRARRFTALVRASGVGKAALAGRNAVADFEDWTRKAGPAAPPPSRPSPRDWTATASRSEPP